MQRRQLLSLERLGERIVPNATAVLPIVGPIAVAAPLHHLHHHSALSGQGDGSFTGNSLMVDAAPTYNLQGSANLADLGQVSVQGSVTGVGFINNGHATGSLTFTNSKGSVTVDLTGPAQQGFSVLPHYLHYKVVGGTGAYQHLREEGTLRIDLQFDLVPMVARPNIMSHGGPVPTPRGTFDLHI